MSITRSLVAPRLLLTVSQPVDVSHALPGHRPSLRLSQVCDSEWHHLSLSVQFPSVTLYVDGVTFDPALIHDNGAIPNPAPRQRLVVGACWGTYQSNASTQNHL